ncbi:MAG: hypothetical protein NTZ08_02960 [Verrucomicrobia bacterium]|jgi:hypothetical protein|nr:hypothetical protein [Verrucomicrobiota bacterium]
MARKRKSPPRAGWILGLVTVGILFFAAIYLLGSKDSNPARTTPPLDVASYLANANSLRGNIYKLEGTVAESLAWSPDSGRLIAVQTEDDIIPILVTPDFNSMNIQKEQRLEFILEVDEKGILRTRKVTKS